MSQQNLRPPNSSDSRPIADPVQGNVDDPNTGSRTKPTKKTRGTTFDEIIPHPDEVHSRNLVLCFDGTGDQFDDDVC